MKTVFVQEWTETERGWGKRPDGFTIHPTLDALQAYCKDYRNRLIAEYGATAPDEYSYPDGQPASLTVQDDHDLVQRLGSNEILWLLNSDRPVVENLMKHIGREPVWRTMPK